VLERDPGNLHPHFGTAAVAEALQPLRAWAGRQGLDFSGDLSAVAGGDTAWLRQVAGAVLQSGAHSLEVGCVRIWPLAPRVTVHERTISPARWLRARYSIRSQAWKATFRTGGA